MAVWLNPACLVLGQDAPSLPYRVEIELAGDTELTNLLLAVSQARKLEARPPVSALSLRRRAKNDVENLDRALRSRGYYAAAIDLHLDTQARPARVVFRVKPGPLYLMRDTRIEVDPADTDFLAPEASRLGLGVGQPAEAARVLDGEQLLLRSAKEQGFALAALGKRTVVVDHRDRSMSPTLRIRLGERMPLGEVSFVGADDVDPEFLLAWIPWRAGDPFHPDLVKQASDALIDTGLFTTVRLTLGPSVDAQGRLPVTVELTERPHRTIKATLGYETDKGPYVRFGWWHRNFFHAGEQVAVETTGSPSKQGVTSTLHKPAFLRNDQSLVGEWKLENEDTDAYWSFSTSLAGGLEREWKPGIDVTLGTSLRYSKVEGAGEASSEPYLLFSLPAKLDWDFSDNPLDATRGGRLITQLAPYKDLMSSLAYGKALVRYRQYVSLRKEPRLVLAGRAVLGRIVGADSTSVPADDRFYAGGGGSLRGFGYQLASPLDDKGDPVGGNSLLEMSLELRAEVTSRIGVVGFVDAGGAFSSGLPDVNEDFFVGVGGGLRYATPIGPLRLDVGFPVNPREGVDDPYQIYVSIGQAF